MTTSEGIAEAIDLVEEGTELIWAGRNSDSRTALAEDLENALDGETNFDFTWLFCDWELNPPGTFLSSPQRAYSVVIEEVHRGIHPAYVFVRGRRDNLLAVREPVVAVLHAHREVK